MTENLATPENKDEVSAKVTECLSKLPQESPDEIADFLRKNGFKGYRTNGQSCPIARYLHKCSGYSNITVGGMRVTLSYTRPCTRLSECQGTHLESVLYKLASVSPTITEFITRFDAGQFPDLIEGS